MPSGRCTASWLKSRLSSRVLISPRRAAMRVELTEVLWLEEHAVSLPELAELAHLSPGMLEELVGPGAIEPIDTSSPEPRFGAAALNAARHVSRLRDDFDLDAQALPLVLG